jgi:SpoVK/Ycf46/Vps4 family AAA+-type ATPase
MDSNNRSMNGENKNPVRNRNGNNQNKNHHKKNNSNPVIINHYHYNGMPPQQSNQYQGRNQKHYNRHRHNNRGRGHKNNNIDSENDKLINLANVLVTELNDMENENKPTQPTIPNQPNNPPSPKNHRIILRTNLNNGMRIIPLNPNMNPFMFSPDIVKTILGQEFEKKEEKNDEEKKEEEFVELNDVKNLDDLIKIGENYELSDKRRYPIDMVKLKKIVGPLKELKNVIGMESVKTNIFEQLLFILQDLNDTNMMHTVIEGPPGVGKTLLGKILAKIYCKLDFLKKPEENKDEKELQDFANHILAVLNPSMPQPSSKKEEKKEDEDEVKFKVVRRSDLIGQYVGSTAIKTQKVIDEAAGGVLFIDEVYSLGSGNNGERQDTFAKEAIDTLNQNLSEHGDKFICIIAGYPDEIERCFFSQNAGLKRRFPFKYSIEKYDSKELSKIFEFKVQQIKWSLHNDLKLEEVEKFIEKNKKHFEHFGGDIENLLLSIKIKHSTRVFGKNPDLRKKITMEDIKAAFEEFQKTRKEKELPQFVKDLYC